MIEIPIAVTSAGQFKPIPLGPVAPTVEVVHDA